MLKAKRKLKKKELKQDKFVMATIEAKAFVEENISKILYAVLGVLVIAILAYFYVQSKASAEQTAISLLSRAESELQNNQKENAISIYQEIIDQYDGTNAAGKATYTLAKIYREDNDPVMAKTYFKKYIDDYDGKNIMMQAASAGYADCLFAEKNYDEAAKYYERAANIEPEFPMAMEYLYSAAQAYKEAGNTGKAKALAQKIIDENKNAVIKNNAEILLKSLNS